MMEEEDKKLILQLKRHEGYSEKLYKDTATPPKLTIGYGWNIEDTGIDRNTAEVRLIYQMEHARADAARAFPWMLYLTRARQNVIVNMTFNMGIGTLKTFKQTLSAMAAGNADLAAERMLQSLWAKQVGSRAKELSDQYRQG